MSPRVRAVLLDAAGTLLEPREPVGETYARIARAHGADIPARRLAHAFAGAHAAAAPMAFPDASEAQIPALEREWWRDLVHRTFHAADPTARLRDFPALFSMLWDHFADPSAWCLASGAKAGLMGLRRRGLATGIVSNFDARLPGILEGMGLAPLLDAVVLPMHARACKPSPAIFRAGLAAVGATAGESVYVGDRPDLDLLGARAVGMRAIDVTGLATLADLAARILDGEEARPGC